MIRHVLFYVFFLSIPVFLGLSAWQTSRYGDLERELNRLERTQEEWVENNKRLIAGIALLSSPDRIEHIARNELGLQRKQPEEVLQISIINSPVNMHTATNEAPNAYSNALHMIQQLLDGEPDE
jgi:cell division protein FtsL